LFPVPSTTALRLCAISFRPSPLPTTPQRARLAPHRTACVDTLLPRESPPHTQHSTQQAGSSHTADAGRGGVVRGRDTAASMSKVKWYVRAQTFSTYAHMHNIVQYSTRACTESTQSSTVFRVRIRPTRGRRNEHDNARVGNLFAVRSGEGPGGWVVVLNLLCRRLLQLRGWG
jgi:hypothetical protein